MAEDDLPTRSESTAKPAAEIKQAVTAQSARLRDPFSDTTRERQKWLLVAAVVTLCLARSLVSVKTLKTEAFEIDVESAGIVRVFAIATAYLTLLFAAGAIQEIRAAKAEIDAEAFDLLPLTQKAGETPEAHKIAAISPEDTRMKELDAVLASRNARLQKLLEEHAELEAKIKERPANREDLLIKLLKVGDQITEAGDSMEDLWDERIARKRRAPLSPMSALVKATVLDTPERPAAEAAKIARPSSAFLWARQIVEVALPILFGIFATIYGCLHQIPKVDSHPRDEFQNISTHSYESLPTSSIATAPHHQ